LISSTNRSTSARMSFSDPRREPLLQCWTGCSGARRKAQSARDVSAPEPARASSRSG
jgi:hypothetical protein